MPDWDEDSTRLVQNLDKVGNSLGGQARKRSIISVEDARAWHKGLMDGLDTPNPDYVGRFRGEPGLESIDVIVGMRAGMPPEEVESALKLFETHVKQAIKYLDDCIPQGVVPNGETLYAVLDVCGWVHAEWVRIHPFANGNGRTARLWANLIAKRYGLPMFIRLRPRPDGNRYATAAAAAMEGNWQLTADLFRDMLDEFLDRLNR